jgi:hypothetical protein
MSTSDVLYRNRAVRNLVMDYALGGAIVGLSPFQNLLTLTLIIAAVLLFKMVRDIRAQWGFLVKPGVLTIIGNLLSFVGALGASLMAWGSVIALSFFIPVVNRLAIVAALFTLFWLVGMGTNQYYLNRHPIDAVMDASEEAL